MEERVKIAFGVLALSIVIGWVGGLWPEVPFLAWVHHVGPAMVIGGGALMAIIIVATNIRR